MTADIAIAAPDWSQPLKITALVVILIGNAALVLPLSLSAQRWLYWAGSSLGALFLAGSIAYGGLKVALLAGGATLFASVLLAYFSTTYLKIGGRIRSPYIARTGATPPPDAYRGHVLPSTAWWAAAAFAVAGGGLVFMADSPSDNGFVIACGAITSLYLAGLGHLDKADGFPVARTQYVPLAVTVAACIPLLLLPVAAYFAAYWASPRKSDANEDSPEEP
ncbi:hypothetical protein [Mycolicibacterium mengxianglii]|uniref:hypothetical protein n=1 Tax=Mycolicibacterium mengxianglii TaxID=2736649 RepID=UPI0018D08902|nr:hypothetical protein [Mycolicibacterium mengxianglii]